MATILLPIKTEYVKRILSGEKTFEYRKCKPKQNIDKIVIYETSPKKRVVGFAEVKGVITDTPARLWESTRKSGGITKKKYMEYFCGKDEAYAYILGKVHECKNEIRLKQIGISQSPQSYMYLDDNQFRKIKE